MAFHDLASQWTLLALLSPCFSKSGPYLDRQAAPASPGHLSEVQTGGPHPKSTEPGTLGAGPQSCFNKKHPPRCFSYTPQFENHKLQLPSSMADLSPRNVFGKVSANTHHVIHQQRVQARSSQDQLGAVLIHHKLGSAVGACAMCWGPFLGFTGQKQRRA